MTTKTIKPLGNRVLVKRSSAQKTKGGIILPETAQEKPRQGEIVAVGPGKIDEKGQRQAMHVSIGDKILFSSYAGTEEKKEQDEVVYHIMSEEDILGILV